MKSVQQLFQGLIKFGYRYCEPKASTWVASLIYKQDATALCVLIRKNGVDLRYYPAYDDDITINNENIASFRGGQIFRFSYAGIKQHRLHTHILLVAKLYARGIFKTEMLDAEASPVGQFIVPAKGTQEEVEDFCKKWGLKSQEKRFNHTK